MIKVFGRKINSKLVISILFTAVFIAIAGYIMIETNSRRITQSQISIKQAEGSKFVNNYMALVSSGNIDKADKLLAVNSKSEVKTISTLYKTDGYSPNLPWSSILYERNLILRKIIDEKSENENIQVYAQLSIRNAQNANIFAIFHLTKEGETLLIEDIELKPGKTD